MPETPNPFEELEEPSVDDSASQQQEPEQSIDDGGEAETASPSTPSQTATTTSPAKGLLGSLHPQVPPTPNDWPKIYQAMKAMEGRVKAAQRAGTQLTPEVQQKVSALNDYLSIPGMQDVLGIYFDQRRSTGRDFDIRELFQGSQSAPQAGQKQPQQQRQDEEDLLAKSPAQFRSWMRDEMQRIADERARGIADPLYQQVGSMKMESEMASLQQKGYVDLPKYADQINHILSTMPNLSVEQAYYLAKGQAGGFGRPRPNAQAAFSEGAGSRGEQDGGVSSEEQMRREIMMSGQNGRL